MIRHVASLAEIVEDVDATVRFYREVLGADVRHEPGAPYALALVPGVLHYGIWSRAAAAERIFGDASHAARVPLGFTVGFEVDALPAAAAHVQTRGAEVVHAPREEPWGQHTARTVLPSGAIAELAETPWARALASDVVPVGSDDPG